VVWHSCSVGQSLVVCQYELVGILKQRVLTFSECDREREWGSVVGSSEIVVSNRIQIWTNLSLASGICWLIRLLHLSLVAQVKKRTNPHLNWTCKIRTKHKFLAKLDMFELELPPKQYRHLALQVWVGGLIYEHVQTKAVQN